MEEWRETDEGVAVTKTIRDEQTIYSVINPESQTLLMFRGIQSDCRTGENLSENC